MNHNQAFINLVDDAKTRIKEITVSELQSMMDEETNIRLIDVREEKEWQQGFIPGAIHLSKGVLECYIEEVVLDKKTPIVLYCGGGFRSALATDNLQKMGYQQVFSLTHGYRGWQQLNNQ